HGGSVRACGVFQARRAPTGGRRPPRICPELGGIYHSHHPALNTLSLSQARVSDLCLDRAVYCRIASVRGLERPRGRNPPAARGGGGNPAVALSKATLPWLPFRFPG